jgi:predicted ATP-grasp superfamily ATP-dependent carboligase
VKYESIFEYGLKLLKALNFSGLASMEFVIDRNDYKPKIIDVNPRFYGPFQCAISAGVDLPYDVYRMTLHGDIETNLTYKEGITCRNLLFEDTKHMLSVMQGIKSPKYTVGKMATLLNYLNFFRDDSYFILSSSDPMPAIRKILSQFNSTIPVSRPTTVRVCHVQGLHTPLTGFSY